MRLGIVSGKNFVFPIPLRSAFFYLCPRNLLSKNMATRRRTVSVLGPNQTRCNVDVYQFGQQLGRELIQAGYTVVCGGVQGFMEAVCKGARSADNYTYGCTVGILPGDTKEQANEYVDIVIPTGMGWARNQLIVNAADAIVSVAGGAGTLSELAYAWQSGKPVVCYTAFEGWTQRLADMQIDLNHKGVFKAAKSIPEILSFIRFGVSGK